MAHFNLSHFAFHGFTVGAQPRRNHHGLIHQASEVKERALPFLQTALFCQALQAIPYIAVERFLAVLHHH